MKFVSLVLLGLFGLLIVCQGYSEWNYEGENYWPIIFPACAGGEQSPIDIDTSRVQDIYLYNNMKFQRYSNSNPGTWEHKNYTLQWTYTGSNAPRIRGGFLFNNWYALERFHLSWGAEDCRGSEHTIDGVPTQAEIQFLHYKEAYGNFDAASLQSDGLMGLSVLLRKGEAAENSTILKDIFDAAELLANDPKATPSESITFMGNIFTDTYTNVGRGYYYYEGSLTFPMCNEDVQWMIMEKTLTISHYQMERLRALRDLDGDPIHDNFRRPQPKNNRVVKRVFN